MRRRLAALALLAATSAAGLAVAEPAGANACPDGWACMWRDTSYVTNGYSGGHVRFGSHIDDYRRYTYAGTGLSASNSSSSLWNKTLQQTFFFTHSYHQGAAVAFGAYGGDGNLSDGSNYIDPGFNNNIESGYRCGALGLC